MKNYLFDAICKNIYNSTASSNLLKISVHSQGQVQNTLYIEHKLTNTSIKH